MWLLTLWSFKPIYSTILAMALSDLYMPKLHGPARSALQVSINQHCITFYFKFAESYQCACQVLHIQAFFEDQTQSVDE